MRPQAARPRAGSTLIELLVVLSILAVLAAVVAPGLHVTPRALDAPGSSVRDARAAAIRSASPVRATERDQATVRLIHADPTGRVVIDSVRATRVSSEKMP